MKWMIKTLKPGDHIRVKQNWYFHHGVYIGNNEVIHFTGPEGAHSIDPTNTEVRKTTVEEFSKNQIVEVAIPSFFEKIYCRKSSERIKLATNSLGEKGYDFNNNNCEDFANRCCYKKEMTSQIRKKNM